MFYADCRNINKLTYPGICIRGCIAVMRDVKLEAKWEARLRRLGLSMNRGNSRSRLSYVDPHHLMKIIEKRQASGKKIDPW